MHFKTAGLIITYNPEFPLNFKHIVSQVDKLVVVDNGSKLQKEIQVFFDKFSPNIKLIKLPENQGIAKALNAGFEYLASLDYQWVVTLDQDSEADANMVLELNNHLSTKAPEEVAAIGPQIIDLNTPHKKTRYLLEKVQIPFKRVSIDREQYDNLLYIITSGALTSVAAWEDLGGFKEDFFIDYVDTEFFMRANSKGYKVYGCHKAKLFHRLGDRVTKSTLGIKVNPTNHAAVRRYYIARNSIPMLKKYALKYPHWLIYDILAHCLNLFRITFYEADTAKKLWHALQGYKDGLLGRMGKAPKI